MYGFVILSLVAAASANVYYDTPCPDVRGVSNFNFKAYGTGAWFEAARYPNDAETGGACSSSDYTLEGDTIKLTSYHVNDGKLATIEGSAKLAYDAGNTGKLMFELPYGANGSKQRYPLYILDTDYNNYAIQYHCGYNSQKRTRQDFAWIMVRSQQIDAKTRAAINEAIRKSRVIDTSKLTWIDLSDNACTLRK